MVTKKFTTMFNITARPVPNTTIVDAICPWGDTGRYWISQANRKQILQIKATLQKNNSFRINRVSVKLHYFIQP